MLFTSWAVNVIPVMAVPAVCGEEMADIPKWSSAPALTVKVLVPVLEDPVTIKVMPVPAVIGVTVTPVSTPEVKAAEVPVMPAVPL